jgi:hypothetical protein
MSEERKVGAGDGHTFVVDSRSLEAENARLRDDLTREQNRSQMYADIVRGVAVALHGPGYTDASKLPEEVEALKALLSEAADYTRHPDYDWPVEFSRQVSDALDAAKGGE